MRKLVVCALMLAFLNMSINLAISAEQRDFEVSVDEDGNYTKETEWVNLERMNGQDMYIVCDPASGEPKTITNAEGKKVGEAYIYGKVIGTQKVTKVDDIKLEPGLDFDNPVEVLPIECRLRLPNVPSKQSYIFGSLTKTGQAQYETDNMLGWPSDYSFGRLLTSDDEWLMVAEVINPNECAIKAEVEVYLTGFMNWQPNPISKNIEVELMPKETKYLLLNPAIMPLETCFAKRLEEYIGGPQWSEGRYLTRILDILSLSSPDIPEYPQSLKTAGIAVGFTPFKEWDGTDPQIHPVFPMRLGYEFSCYVKENDRTVMYSGTASMDPNTEKWNISLYDISDTVANDTKKITELFNNWGINVPYKSKWEEGYRAYDLQGALIKNHNYIDYVVMFRFLTPMPINPPSPTWDIWNNEAYGGWLGGTVSCASGIDLPGPVLTKDPLDLNRRLYMFNNNRIEVPVGNFSVKGNADTRYYDLDWMNMIPVIKATPMFINKWGFTATDGDIGVLTKKTVLGYNLHNSTIARPTINLDPQISKIEAELSGSGISITITWDVNGWVLPKKVDWENVNGIWNIKATYDYNITGNNPSEAYFIFDDYRRIGNIPQSKKTLSFADTNILNTETVKTLTDLGNNSSLTIDPVIDTSFNHVYLDPQKTTDMGSISKSFTLTYEKQYKKLDPQTLQTEAENIIQAFSALNKKTEAAQINGVLFLNSDLSWGRKTKSPLIISGAKRVLIHGQWGYDRKWGDYCFKRNKANKTVLGFPNALDLTAMSYMGSASPTEGLVVEDNSPILTQLLNDKCMKYYGGPFTPYQYYSMQYKKLNLPQYPQT